MSDFKENGFDYSSSIKVLEDFNSLSEKRQYRFIKQLILDETFIKWLFMPPQLPNINDLIGNLYAQLTRQKVLRIINEVITEVGYREFTNSHATLLCSLANIAIGTNNDIIDDTKEQARQKLLSPSEVDKINKRCEKYSNVIADTLKIAKKITKPMAKEMMRDSGLPKHVCIMATRFVPEYKYVDKYKVGFYLNILLSNIYSEVEMTEEPLFEDDIRWKPFFKILFGKENLVEVATFILLEGVKKCEKYKSHNVTIVWESLTQFALRELESAPDNIRSQMIELYIKRIDRMFANKAFDLRVDITSLSETMFPQLVETVSKYIDKITSILSRGKDQ